MRSRGSLGVWRLRASKGLSSDSALRVRELEESPNYATGVCRQMQMQMASGPRQDMGRRLRRKGLPDTYMAALVAEAAVPYVSTARELY